MAPIILESPPLANRLRGRFRVLPPMPLAQQIGRTRPVGYCFFLASLVLFDAAGGQSLAAKATTSFGAA